MPSTRVRSNKQNQSSAPRQNQPINAEVATRRAGQSRQGLAPSLRQESRDNGALPRVIAQDIAAIRFSSHIFADDASLRRVVINGQPLKEGNRFGNGLVLRNITDEGVILEYQGQTVSISVLSQWADD